MNTLQPLTLFITWTTYGSWLPGDRRGWRKWKKGEQQPEPLLAEWCRGQMKESPIVLTRSQRSEVEEIIVKHASIRGWEIHAVSVRTNHVHIAVTAAAEPKKVRDQFKANATRVLRQSSTPVSNKKVWTRGGDIEVIDTTDELARVVEYILDAQGRKDRDQ